MMVVYIVYVGVVIIIVVLASQLQQAPCIHNAHQWFMCMYCNVIYPYLQPLSDPGQKDTMYWH